MKSLGLVRLNRIHEVTRGSCPALLTKRQIGGRYQVSVSCINKWMKQGFPHIRIRYKTVRFNPEVCDLFLAPSPETPQPKLRRRSRRKPLKPEPVQLEFAWMEKDQLFLNIPI
jgi:hypothetical protein